MRVALVLQAYLDGETDEVTTRRVAAHLEDCRRCGLEAETYQKIKSALSGRTEPEPDTARRLRSFAEGLLRQNTDGEEAEQRPGA